MSNWYLVKADYSQLELRIMAVLANDKAMLEAFNQGKDIHAVTASQVLKVPLEKVEKKHRQSAKGINFGLVYGQTAGGLKEFAKKEYKVDFTVDEARLYRKEYFKTYSGIRAYHDKIQASVLDFMWDAVTNTPNKLYVSKTLYGRKRYWTSNMIPMIQRQGEDKRTGEVFDGSRKHHFYVICMDIINHPDQGTASEGMKLAFLDLVQKLHKYKAKPILQVHDEIVLECHKDDLKTVVPLLGHTMRTPMQSILNNKVPIEVEVSIGKRWGETKHVYTAK